MEKKKEVPWTDRKKMYKDGNLDVFRMFNWMTWKNMTEGERAMWTEFSEVARAPIPKETIEFNKKVKAANEPTAISDEGYPIASTYDESAATVPVEEVVIDKMKSALQAELKERGIKFAYNSKLETLEKKLADADNSE